MPEQEPTSDRVIVPFDEAVAMLPEGDSIHTFRQGGSLLLGVDWPREDILDLMKKFPVELAGEHATRAHHGLAVKAYGASWLFIATRKEAPCPTN